MAGTGTEPLLLAFVEKFKFLFERMERVRIGDDYGGHHRQQHEDDEHGGAAPGLSRRDRMKSGSKKLHGFRAPLATA